MSAMFIWKKLCRKIRKIDEKSCRFWNRTEFLVVCGSSSLKCWCLITSIEVSRLIFNESSSASSKSVGMTLVIQNTISEESKKVTLMLSFHKILLIAHDMLQFHLQQLLDNKRDNDWMSYWKRELLYYCYIMFMKYAKSFNKCHKSLLQIH